jgi:hypothetical protein
MKITKETKVVAEEVEFESGIYYWEDDNLICYKIEITDYEQWGEEWIAFKMYSLTNFGNRYGIVVLEDDDSIEDIPYQFKQFILGGRKREITEEKFEKEKQEILKRL